MFKVTIKQGENTWIKNDCADVYQVRKWASVQGVVGFDFEPIGKSKCHFADSSRNATMTIERA